MPVTSRRMALEVVRDVLAADCACSPDDFAVSGVTVTIAEERPGRRRYPRPHKPLTIVTMGDGVVVSCHAERAEWMRENLGTHQRDEIFAPPVIARIAALVARDGQTLRGPNPCYAVSAAEFRPATAPPDVVLEYLEGPAIHQLYELAGFEHALAYQTETPRPDMLAAVATRRGEVVAVAAASADSETLWQLGVDVLPKARGVGIGRAVVSAVTDAVLQSGRVPFYAAAISNVHSRSLAATVGYWPAWTDIYVVDDASAAASHAETARRSSPE